MQWSKWKLVWREAEPDFALVKTPLEKIYLLELGQDPFADLVIPAGKKNLLLASVGSFSKQTDRSPTQILDPVRDPASQNGLIILFHGGPGTGKSMTAQCLADYVTRPLLPLSLGRIGTTAQEIQRRLTETFQLADQWDCIILIDDADVLLEERSVADMQRNSVVTGMFQDYLEITGD